MNKIDISSLTPQLSASVQLQRFDEQSYLLCQTQQGFNFKISEETYRLLQLVNGQTNLKTIAEQLGKEFDIAFSTEVLFDILYKKFGPYGVIEQDFYQAKEKRKPAYLWLSFNVINQKYTNLLAQYFTPLFKQWLACFVLVVGLFVFGWVWKSLPALSFSNFSPQTSFHVFLFFFTMSISKLLHEIGHAAASRFYQVESKAIGFGFYLLLPVVFADVSGIWRLKVAQRIVVNLAGMYFEFLWNSFLILLLLLIGYPSLTIFPVFIFATTLFNFFPFGRFDGYWILSDLSGQPNLMQKSQEQLKLFVQALWSFQFTFHFTLQTCFLLIYGLISQLFIVVLLAYLLFNDVNAIVSFPQQLVQFLVDLWRGKLHWWTDGLTLIQQFTIPFLFYFILFRKGITYFFAYRKKREVP